MAITPIYICRTCFHESPNEEDAHVHLETNQTHSMRIEIRWIPV